MPLKRLVCVGEFIKDETNVGEFIKDESNQEDRETIEVVDSERTERQDT